MAQSCDQPGCPDPGQPTAYCEGCCCSLCDACWDKPAAHNTKKVRSRGNNHKRIDLEIVQKYETILEPDLNQDGQRQLHTDDEDTTWFGVDRNDDNEPIFHEFPRYSTLLAEGLLDVRKVRHPKLVSFVGQTGVGKSTLVNMLIKYEPTPSKRATNDDFPTPVVGSPNDDVPVSADVHLYAEPNTFMTAAPVFYADCEGLQGGEMVPRAEALRARDEITKLDKKQLHLSEEIPRLHMKQHVKRKLMWAVGDRDKSKREFAVKWLYPKLLYTFSDVVVFVLPTSKTFESKVLPNLVEWADNSIEKSVGQPILPHLVVVLNATELSIDESQWDVKETTKRFLHDFKKAFESLPIEVLERVSSWSSSGKNVETTEELLEFYYSSVSIVRVPAKGNCMLMHEQVGKLYRQIAIKCNDSHYMKGKLQMLANGDDLQSYLHTAFDNFANDLKAPFDFIETGRMLSPVDSSFRKKILKFAIVTKDCATRSRDDLEGILGYVSVLVSSSLMLDKERKSRLGSPQQLLETHYAEHIQEAFAEFADLHWPCSFVKHKAKNGRCVNVATGHNAKGHQNSEGEILIAKADYVASFNRSTLIPNAMTIIQTSMGRIANLVEKSKSSEQVKDKKIIYETHDVFVREFLILSGCADIKSNTVCLYCLLGSAVHSLPCGHILCDTCAHDQGEMSSFTSLCLPRCPICTLNEKIPESGNWSNFKIATIPPLASARVLSLDGGGVRGIVELESLRAIEQNLPANIPIRYFFDLIVGTSTGGIIALGLGIEEWSVEKCIERFINLCGPAFTPRSHMPLWRRFKAMNHEWAWYRTTPLIQALRSSFSKHNRPLFGDQHSSQLSPTKVAVTAASDTFQTPVTIANYNRPPFSRTEQPTYRFERAEHSGQELEVWEAARATSAAPTYFTPHRSTRNNRGYVDGAVFHNNPVFIADRERRFIWRATANTYPDILLSLGTGQNEDTAEQFHLQLRSQAVAATRIAPQIKSKSPKGRIRGKKTLELLLDRAKDITDTERIWRDFVSNSTYPSRDLKDRFFRINPDIGIKPPDLDDVDSVGELQERVRKVLQTDVSMKLIVAKVARHLVASSFFATIEEKPHFAWRETKTVSVSLHCKFPSRSDEIRHLAHYFEDFGTASFTPSFVIRAKGKRGSVLGEWLLTSSVRTDMAQNSTFTARTLTFSRPPQVTMFEIILNLKSEEELPISGFPRNIYDVHEPETSITQVHDDEEKMDAAANRSSNSFTRTPSSERVSDVSLTYSELLDLHREARWAVKRFARDRVALLQAKNGTISRRLRTLLRLVEDTHEYTEGIEGDDENDPGPYTTILHTAAALGSPWLAELAMQADPDTSLLDRHNWSALTIATVQGHQSCIELLSDTSSPNPASIELQKAPSELTLADSDFHVHFTKEALTASVNEWHDSLADRIQVRANHPIPSTSTTFYYEVEILRSGPLRLVAMGLCRPETDVTGMPGWRKTSWGYHGDDGCKFNHPVGIGSKYAEPYAAGDVVGCGLSLQTSQLFFTRNGVNLGIAFDGVYGMLFPVIGFGEDETAIKVNFGPVRFRYDIHLHDWSSGPITKHIPVVT